MNPLVGAALIEGGTSLLGGLLGGGTRGTSRENRQAAFGALQGQILAGQEFGLHPLAAIGAASGGSPQYSGNYIGEGIAQAGRAAGDSIRAANAKDPLETQQKRLLEAQIEETQSRTRLNNMNSIRTPPIDPYGIRRENALIEVKLENGEIVRIPNPDVYEIGPSELVTGRTILEGGRIGERYLYGDERPPRIDLTDPTGGKDYLPPSMR